MTCCLRESAKVVARFKDIFQLRTDCWACNICDLSNTSASAISIGGE